MSSRKNQNTGESTPRSLRSSNIGKTTRNSGVSQSKLQGLSLSEDDPPTATTTSETPQKEHEHNVSPSERGKRGISHGMSPHDRGVLGAQARWAKAHSTHESQMEIPEKGKGG